VSKMGLMSINENSSGNDPGPSENASGSVGVNSVTSMAKASVWPSSSSVPEINAASQVLDLPDESENATFPKVTFSVSLCFDHHGSKLEQSSLRRCSSS
jgi:hypothetical protein